MTRGEIALGQPENCQLGSAAVGPVVVLPVFLSSRWLLRAALTLQRGQI